MMVLGKLCLILACTNNAVAQSWNTPIYRNWSSNDSLAGFAINMTKWFSKRLKPEDQAMHTQSVYHALNNLENGELVEWFNDRTDAQGKARIVYTYPANGNVCRRIHSWVRFGADEKTFEDTACFYNSINGWKFIDKY
jgi:surface antigen